MAELLSFGGLLSRWGFSESGNVALVNVLTAKFGKYMAIPDACNMIE